MSNQALAPAYQQEARSILDHMERENDAWPEAQPLQRQPSEPTPFPVDALGDVLGNAAKAQHEVIQAPLAICGNSVLAAAALAAQGHANIVIDGREHPLSENFVTIGKTGERKSAVDNVALKPHREWQRELNSQYRTNLEDYKRSADAFKKAKDEAMGAKSKTYDSKKKALSELGDAPEEPLMPYLICTEPTYEGLVKMLAHGQPSIGLFSDEGGQFIGGHGMSQDNMLKTASGMSGLWDGREISRVRAGDGAVLLLGKRVSFHLMVQPDIGQILLSNHLLNEQGLLSRCLVTWPNTTAGTRIYREVDLSAVEQIKVYSEAMRRLLEIGVPIVPGTRNELDPRRIELDAEAKRIWIDFHDYVERELVEDGELAQIRGLASKAPEHAARLAGILALVDDMNCGAVSARWISSGIELVTHYLNEAIRLYEAGASDPDLRDAEKLLLWLQNRPSKIVSLVEIYQKGPSAVRNAKRARELMRILEQHGYTRPTLDPESKRKEAWSIRP